MAGLQLGWKNPRPNDFASDDQRPLRDTFSDLQRFLTFPYVGLRFSGTMDLSSTLAAIPFTPKSSAASPFIPGDPYSLWRSGSSQIQVPHDFDTWMAAGIAGGITSGGASAAVATFMWRVNSSTDVWGEHKTGQAGSRTQATILRPVRKGDTIEVAVASGDITEDLNTAEAWIIFLPLT